MKKTDDNNTIPVTKEDIRQKAHEAHDRTSLSPTLERKINDITIGLRSEFSRGLHSISEENALVIVDYIQAMKTEINPSDNYRKDSIKTLYTFSKYNNNKPFKHITRDDIFSFLESLS